MFWFTIIVDLVPSTAILSLFICHLPKVLSSFGNAEDGCSQSLQLLSRTTCGFGIQRTSLLHCFFLKSYERSEGSYLSLFFSIDCQLYDDHILKMEKSYHLLNMYYWLETFHPLSYQSYNSPMKKVLLDPLYTMRKWRFRDIKLSSQVH